MFNGGRDSVWKEKNIWGWRVVTAQPFERTNTGERCIQVSETVSSTLSPQLRKRRREVGSRAKVSEQGQGRAWHPSPAE